MFEISIAASRSWCLSHPSWKIRHHYWEKWKSIYVSLNHMRKWRLISETSFYYFTYVKISVRCWRPSLCFLRTLHIASTSSSDMESLKTSWGRSLWGPTTLSSCNFEYGNWRAAIILSNFSRYLSNIESWDNIIKRKNFQSYRSM